MATFDYNYVQIHNSGGNVTSFSGTTGTLTDTSGTTFVVGETLTGVSRTVVFQGTFTEVIGGTTYTFIQAAATGSPAQTYIFGAIGTLSPTVVAAELDFKIGTDSPLLTTTPFTPCFMAGTLIATPEGARAVETLVTGDLVLTADGRAVPVRWMGQKTVHKALTPEQDFAPVRVTAGALGAGLPQADLLLTGDHALIVDGLAVNASVLVNGTTIVWEPMDSLPATVTYWHIETEAHEEILANGAAAETFIDYVGRSHFDNHQEYLDLYGCERIIPETRRTRISARRQLPAALAARFGIGSFGDAVDAEFAALVDAQAAA